MMSIAKNRLTSWVNDNDMFIISMWVFGVLPKRRVFLRLKKNHKLKKND